VVSDIYGRRVAIFTLSRTEGNYRWDSTLIPNGVYIFNLQLDNGIADNGKIVIEK
jgi:hypothetical protein